MSDHFFIQIIKYFSSFIIVSVNDIFELKSFVRKRQDSEECQKCHTIL
jgi:hypothetical protein